MNVKYSSDSRNNGFGAIKYWQPKGAEYELVIAHRVTCSMPSQVSPSYAIGLVEQGWADFSFEGRQSRLSNASLMLVEPDKPFGRSGCKQAPRSVRGITIQPGYFASLISRAVGKRIVAPKFSVAVQANRQVTTAFALLHRRLEVSQSASERASAMQVLGALLADHCIDVEATSEHADPRIIKVKSFLLKNSAQTVSLEHLAGMVGLSTCRLNRLFSATVGVPPHAYQNQIRVWQAKKMLAAGMTIADVACSAGFYDQAHFARHFKKLTGLTPGVFLSGARQ